MRHYLSWFWRKMAGYRSVWISGGSMHEPWRIHTRSHTKQTAYRPLEAMLSLAPWAQPPSFTTFPCVQQSSFVYANYVKHLWWTQLHKPALLHSWSPCICPTEEGALNRLQIVFQKLRDNNLKLSKKKCHSMQGTVKFLGHVIGQDGVAMEPA